MILSQDRTMAVTLNIQRHPSSPLRVTHNLVYFYISQPEADSSGMCHSHPTLDRTWRWVAHSNPPSCWAEVLLNLFQDRSMTVIINIQRHNSTLSTSKWSQDRTMTVILDIQYH